MMSSVITDCPDLASPLR